jgi:hypothetical protein
MKAALAACVAIPAALAALPAAADPPGSPVDLQVYQRSDRFIALTWRNTHDPQRSVAYLIDETVDGVPKARRYIGMSGTRGTGPYDGETSGSVDDLVPETDYCFRLWVRSQGGTFSAAPTNWACARTMPSAPLAPLNVRAHRQRTLDAVSSPAIVEWSTPDQSAHRPVARYEIERKSLPAAKVAWVVEQSQAQAGATPAAFRVKSSALPATGEHAFRVCAINERARTCSGPVTTTWSEMGSSEYAAAPPRFRPDPARGIEAMPKLATGAASAAPFSPATPRTTFMKAPSALGRSQ